METASNNGGGGHPPSMETASNNGGGGEGHPPSMETASNNGGGGGEGSSEQRPKRKNHGKGRKKVEIEKIKDKFSLIVSFSKRRKGLFHKALELCNLCDAEASVITFSPMGKSYTMGSPSVEALIDRFISENCRGGGDPSAAPAESAHPADAPADRRCCYWWWEKPIEGLDEEELEEYRDALAELRRNVTMRVEDMRYREASTRDFLSGWK